MTEVSTSMYTLKPIVALPELITLPTVMYELPRIQGGAAEQQERGDIAADVARQVPLPEYDLLETRQMKILKQLCELKEQVEYLCVAVRLSDNKGAQIGTSTLGNQIPIHAEIIISANPASPPYSILALQRIWKDIKFNISTYFHSTVSNASTNSFEEKLLANVNNDAVHSIDLKLIWKDVRDVQLITKVYDYPLEGEANILRYLTRLIENYNYEKLKSVEESNKIDTILDLCLRLSHEEPRNVIAIFAKFISYLGKDSWLLDGTDPSIVDIAVWSIIKRVACNKMPRDLKSWYDLCQKTFLSA